MNTVELKTRKLELPPLPYSYNALEPVISEEIMRLHHDKHHLSYVKGANTAMEKLAKFRKGDDSINLREVLRDLSFHMNGHVLHSLFWKAMRPPEEGNRPTGALLEAIEGTFGSFEAFVREFSASAKKVEGVGWGLLVKDEEGNLYVLNIEKHNLMHIAGFKPILALDVWEHAYYLQYKNDRGRYVDSWWSVVNWDYVEKIYGK